MNGATPSGEFRTIYKHFTTIDGDTLRFRGGEPQEVREKLQALASMLDGDAYAALDESEVERLYAGGMA